MFFTALCPICEKEITITNFIWMAQMEVIERHLQRSHPRVFLFLDEWVRYKS